MLKTLITLALLAAMFSGIGGIKQADAPVKAGSDNPFIVGVVRPDGVIVPFARYANRRWSNPWHSPVPDAHRMSRTRSQTFPNPGMNFS